MTTLDIHCRSENTTFVKLKEALPFTQTVYQTEWRNLNQRYSLFLTKMLSASMGRQTNQVRKHALKQTLKSNEAPNL